MATSSFDKQIKISSDKVADNLIQVMAKPSIPVTMPINIKKEIERGEALLKKLYSR